MVPERKYLIHPSFIVLALILFAITSLFLAFSISYIYTRIDRGLAAIQLPTLFYINAIILFFSSRFLSLAKKAYLKDETQPFKLYIFLSLILAVVFMLSQVVAWNQMMNENLFIGYSNMTSFIYLLSGAHLLHVLGGIPFLAFFYIESLKYMKDPVTVFIYFSDVSKLRKLRLISIYWHYLDVLWIYLILFFLINTFI